MWSYQSGRLSIEADIYGKYIRIIHTDNVLQYTDYNIYTDYDYEVFAVQLRPHFPTDYTRACPSVQPLRRPLVALSCSHALKCTAIVPFSSELLFKSFQN